MPTNQQRLQSFLGVEAVFVSNTMLTLLAMVERISPTNATVLITGESGTGKEVIARAIHHYSLRSGKAWVDINCAALPDHLLESELFGYEKGAFSGADSCKPGLIEVASGGTLFLDEIGDLDIRMQVKLLRILDGTSYFRLGGVKKVSVDVRLITATNQDLKVAVEKGRFRSDLYHRLCQIRLKIPPLRERPQDIVPLAEFYLAAENPKLRFSPATLHQLMTYSWPGNVRELRNSVLRAAIITGGPEIQPGDLPEEISSEQFETSLKSLAKLDDLERSAILKALQESAGHQRRAADQLGISRRTLQRKMKAYNTSAIPAEWLPGEP